MWGPQMAKLRMTLKLWGHGSPLLPGVGRCAGGEARMTRGGPPSNRPFLH